MKIAVLTSGILPVPAVQGGAVENLVDFYLEYNDRHRLHHITVYSVWHPHVEQHPALHSTVNHYHYIKVESPLAKIRKRLLHWLHRNSEYYHYTIEYYLHEALKHIRRQHYDLIILENRPGYALHSPSLPLTPPHSPSLPLTPPLIFHLHNDLLNDQVPHYQTLYDSATRIITVSHFIKSRVQTINPRDTKTLTIHNGIDVQAFAAAAPAHRHVLGLRDDDFVLVFSGRMTHEKGIMQLVEAMHLLKDHHRIRLIIIGSSFYANAQGQDPFVSSLKEKARQLADNIIFTGFIPYQQMPAYLKMADIAVLPSLWDEPFGLTCIEAMACSLPVITTSQGGIPETVTPDCGILLPADNRLPNALAEAILQLYRNPQQCTLMAEAAKRRSLLFNKETYARQFFEALA